jgi:hypothetical protein
LSLIKCPECGKEFSDSADTCVHCGYKAKAQKKEGDASGCGIGCLLIVFILYLFFSGCSETLEKASKQSDNVSNSISTFEPGTQKSMYVMSFASVFKNRDENKAVGHVKRGASVNIEIYNQEWARVIFAPVRDHSGKRFLEANEIGDNSYIKLISLSEKHPNAH